ncbi:MAG: hypothetical protein HY675_20275 [Chloroflexi bacterium]|nr:hypothetical protein [Chloroflexota bacterium]
MSGRKEYSEEPMLRNLIVTALVAVIMAGFVLVFTVLRSPTGRRRWTGWPVHQGLQVERSRLCRQ